MKLAILGLCLVVQIIAAPNRVRRDAPILPAWDIPTLDFEGRNDNFVRFGEIGTFRDEYGVPHEDYGVPHEDYGVPHNEYGPPPALREVVTEHYCPEEDIVPVFAPAPPAPEVLPLPVPVPILRVEAPYPAPVVPHEEYGPPEVPHEEYGPPPILAPYPAPVTTTTEAPTTPLAPLPPPPPIFKGPYPAPVTTTTEAPTTTPLAIRILPYPAPTLPPVVFTEPPTTTTEVSAPYPAPVVKEGPYPAFSGSKYETDSGLANSFAGGFAEPVIVPAVRAPATFVKELTFVKPKIVITKKVIGFPKITALKQKLFRRFIHH